MRRKILIKVLIFSSLIQVLTIISLMVIVIGATVFLYMTPRFTEGSAEPTAASRIRRRAARPPAPPPVASLSTTGLPANASTEATNMEAVSISASNALPINDTASPQQIAQQPQTDNIDPSASLGAGSRGLIFGRTRRATSTPTPEGVLRSLARGVVGVIGEAGSDPVKQFGLLPTLTPTPPRTATPIPSPNPTETATATALSIATETSTPTIAPTHTNTPLPTDTPLPPPTSFPTATSPPTATPTPEYDYSVAEFFNSPTTNSFLMIYVAIVDPREIPIGDMKIVGTRLDHDLTYESPLSTWYYSGQNAPGEVTKSGNVKFEPPGGIETTSWVLYLADAQGNRMSADVPFNVDQNDKQWYFIKFRRKY